MKLIKVVEGGVEKDILLEWHNCKISYVAVL